MPAGQLVRKPDGASWEAAGSLYVAGCTAYASVDAKKPPTNTILFGGAKPSSVSFTVLPGVTAGASLPPCDLSGQPCRPYTPARNGG